MSMQCEHLRDRAHQWCVHRSDRCGYPQCAHENNSVIYCPGLIQTETQLDPAVDLLTPPAHPLTELITADEEIAEHVVATDAHLVRSSEREVLPLSYVNPERINNGCMIYRTGTS